MNRLHLDFSLSKREDRLNFIKSYLNDITFSPSPEELEMCANYILWGKDKDGKNVVQKKEIEIQTKNKTWAKKELESLDALMESPTFNEQIIQPPTEASIKIKKENFSRAKALAETSGDLKDAYIRLFRQIDETDLLINFYELKIGKRKTDPRPLLLSHFTPEELSYFKAKAEKLSSRQYLKFRHLLVELRKEQFSLRDTYKDPILLHSTPIQFPETSGTFENEFPVYPLGLNSNSPIARLLFFNPDEFNPSTYSKEELNLISKFYWEKNKEKPSQYYFNFEELDHVYNLFLQFFEIETASENLESNLNPLLKTLFWYIDFANLSPIHKEILELKIKKVKNQDIANYINSKYNKSYTDNYISTIFKQKIIKKINAAATLHKQIIGNIFFPEEFKKCTTCGRVLLKDPSLFVRKSRSPDGLANRCKRCDKALREERRR